MGASCRCRILRDVAAVGMGIDRARGVSKKKAHRLDCRCRVVAVITRPTRTRECVEADGRVIMRLGHVRCSIFCCAERQSSGHTQMEKFTPNFA